MCRKMRISIKIHKGVIQVKRSIPNTNTKYLNLFVVGGNTPTFFYRDTFNFNFKVLRINDLINSNIIHHLLKNLSVITLKISNLIIYKSNINKTINLYICIYNECMDLLQFYLNNRVLK